MTDILTNGVIVPLVTPYFFEDIFPLIDHIIQGGIDKIFILGTTGEGTKLSQNQKISAIRSIASFIGNRAHLLIGIPSKSLTDSLQLIHISNEIGACASVISPLLIQEDTPPLIDYLLTHSSGNFILYNNPCLTKNRSIPLEQIEPFFSEKRILAIKDSSGDLDYLDRLLEKRGNSHFKIFYGREHHLAKAMERPIDGFVPGCGNIEPQLVLKIWESGDAKSWDRWYELKTAITNKNPNYLMGLKALLQERGLLTSAASLK